METILSAPAAATLVQIAVLVVLALTLYVLVGYAKDTKAIAKVTAEQRDLALRPCVVLENFEPREPMRIAMEHAFRTIDQQNKNAFPSMPVSQPAALEIGGEQRITNVGVGPAISVKVFRVDAAGKPSSDVLFPHLGVNQVVGIGRMIDPAENESWYLEIRYDSASGASFFSRYLIEGRVPRGFSTGQYPMRSTIAPASASP
ncbi:MAG: hypothetical protein WCC53_08315 [Thermoanaerobaculia bacterium]